MDHAGILRSARIQRRCTQSEAARLAGISPQHWGQIERGREYGGDETVASMAKAVGVTPEELETAGRDRAADKLRKLMASQPQVTGDDLDDVLMLQAIMRKLTPGELHWLVAHVDLFAQLRAHTDVHNVPENHLDNDLAMSFVG